MNRVGKYIILFAVQAILWSSYGVSDPRNPGVTRPKPSESASSPNKDFAVPATPKHWVNDEFGVLSKTQRESLDNELKGFEKKTGHQVIVYIGQTTGGAPFEAYTLKTSNTWGVGRRGYDDGVILFVFTRDRKVRIAVGRGLERVLTNERCAQILSDVFTPKMKSGDPDAAVVGSVKAILEVLAPGPKKQLPQS